MKNDEIAELLEQAIPRGVSKAVADDMNLCVRQVQRWRAGEEPSPLAHFLRLFRALYLNNPAGAAIVFAFIEAEYQTLRHTHGHPIPRPQRAANILKEAAEAVNALNLNATDTETRRELVELREAVDSALAELGGQEIHAA